MRARKRLLSLLLCGVMMFSLCPQAVLAEGAAGGTATGGLCEHHPEHTEDCGYTEGTEGTPCNHEHTKDCYTEVTSCVHEHTADCYPEESVSDNTATPSDADTDEPTECGHECSEESGCITKELNCQHEHNGECGYSPATEGTPCGYICEICNPKDSGDQEETKEPETATPSDIPNALEQLITAWEWIDTDENLSYDVDKGVWVLALPGVSESSPAIREDVVALLPKSIAATLNEEQETIPLSGWTCEGYPEAGAESGSYTFTATLPEGYALDGDAPALAVTVELGGAALYATTSNIKYLDENGDEQTTTGEVTIVDDTMTAWNEGWYVVNGEVTIGSRVTVNGDVHLILADGCNLTINSGIRVENSNSLTIYAQSDGDKTGELTARAADWSGDAAIGGNGNTQCGKITINGGIVTAKGRQMAAGIGSGRDGSSGIITINGGVVTASAPASNGEPAGIGGVWGSGAGTITINGGIVNASGCGKGIGSGSQGKTGSIKISGGLVIANGIGTGNYGETVNDTTISDNAVVISSGTINTTNQSTWNGVIFINNDGKVYGNNVTPTEDFEISNGKTLTIDSGKTLTLNNVTLKNSGTIKGSGTIDLSSGGTLTSNGVLGSDLILKYNVASSLKNITGIDAEATITSKTDYTATLTAEHGYVLPDKITVTAGGKTLSGYTYNPSTGELSIPKGKITGNIAITATAVIPLNTPINLVWDSTTHGKATWGAVASASGYSVQLYKDGNKKGTAVPVTGTDHTFTITEAGSYTFTVIAKGDNSNYIDSPESKASSALIYYAVAFDTDGGSTIDGQVVVDGGKVTEPAVPTKTGYTFKGWYKDNITNWNFDTDTVSQNTTIYAKWEANTYSVTLDAKGGKINSGDVKNYTYGVGATLPTDVSKKGYTFAGWYQNRDCSGSPVTEISKTDTGDKTFYAKWISTDAGVTAVSVNEKAGTIDGTTITVVLDYGTAALPTDSSKVSITPATGAKVSGLNTADNGKTWTFTVTAEDGETKENYTIKVSIAPDPATGNREDVNAAKSTIENHDWTVPQATANTEEAVKAWIEGQLAAMNLNGASYTVTMTDSSFTAATEGGEADRDGTNGSFAFTVKLSKGENTGNVATSTYAEATATIPGGKITATPYTKWTVTVSVEGTGTASGGGTFESGSTVTVTATPNGSRDYFIRWTENGAEVSRDAAYSFVLTADRNLIAEFGTHSSSGGGDGGSSTTTYTLTFDTNGGSRIDTFRTSSYGKTVDLSGYVPTREGYDFNGWYSDAGLTNPITEIRLDGNKTVYAGWTKRNPGTGVDNPFTDVKESDWFYNDVMFVYENGLMSGTSSTTFSPNSNTTRAQLAVIFYRMDGSPAVEGNNSFTDVPYGPGTAWYYDAVTWAQQKGIVAGYEDGSFHPNDPITREQLAAFFYNYAKYKGYSLSAASDLSGFTDAGEISLWARDAMKWAVGSGLMNGKGDGILDPKGAATRAEVAAMLHKFIENNRLVPPAVVSGGNGGASGWTQGNTHISNPQTGDSSHIGLWLSLMIASLSALIGLTVIRRRKPEDEEIFPQLV